MERSELINRIVEEKGSKAIPDLIKLLEDEDSEVREIASEALFKLGDDAKTALLKEFHRRLGERNKNDITLLYIIDLLADFGEKSILNSLYKILSLYSWEEAELIIYEALAKLGEGDKVYEILRYFLLEDEERKKLGVQAAMALSYIDRPEVVKDLVRAIESKDFKGEDLEIIKKALSQVVMKNSMYYEILKNLVGENVNDYLG
ncbi:MAG: HEAT repeat domain-containing protein [Thermosipho sp. (in: Bacteria)]|nr:HEAT repeat domain-containing protein [Thermosipho sp. (in: thermotogales)]MCD6104285.1 HEAT repeat domain-containing protein [Thermosipho sp. (in: thermotogales)]